MKPRISMIVPVYNAERYLENCLDSVLAQSREDLEILLIDDGSGDRSAEICGACASRNRRIRLIRQEHRGAAGARNAGLRNCTGDFICFVDADDVIAPDYAERLYRAVSQSGADIARCRWRRFDGEKAPFPKETAPGPYAADFAVVSGREIVKRMILESRETAVWTGLFRRGVLEGLLFEEDRLYEDVMFSCRAYMDRTVALLGGEPLYAYRFREAGASAEAGSLRTLDSVTVRERRIAFLKDRAPELADPARLELSAEILQLLARLEECEENAPARDALRKKLREYPYDLRAVFGAALRVQTKAVLAVGKLSVRGCETALRIRKKCLAVGRSGSLG